jgi:hypothetical protein
MCPKRWTYLQNPNICSIGDIMKEITFVAYCRFGKGDSGETDVEIELTDEEYERVMTLGTDANVYYKGFSNCEELRDIYDKAYAKAIDQMTEEMRDYGELEEEYASDPNWKIDDMYACGVNFPFDFEELLDDH